MAQLAVVCTILLLSAIYGCSTVTTTAPDGSIKTTVQPIDFTQTGIAKFTNADLDAAASRATNAGFPARAQMWQAIKALKVANEQQATACAAAIAASMPSAPSGSFAGAADALEAGAELVATFQVNAQIKANCAPIPIPALPALPAIPRL